MNKNKIYNEKTVHSFRELVSYCATNYGDRTAFTIKDSNKNLHDISFIEFENNIKELGSALLDLGLENKKIALISQDRYEWCCSYFAISTSNNVVVPLDHLLPEIELQRLLIESKVDAIIFDKKYTKWVQEICKQEGSALKYLICMDSINDEDNILSYSKLVEKGKKLIEDKMSKYENISIDVNAMSILIYTSGTTSNPKAVMLSQGNICSNLLCFADSIKDIGKNLVEYKISGLVCVPAVLEIMYKQIMRGIKKSGKYIPFKIMSAISNFLLFFHIDLRRKFFKDILDNLGGNMRTIIYGSASSDKKVIHLFNTIGIVMIQGYGLTETSPVIACENDIYHSEKGSSGFPLYNEEVKIDNPDETGTGEILVKGPNVMLGYYNNPEANKKAFKDGWFCTGDLGRFGKDGCLFISGRIKDLIVLSNGKKVFPEEIEALINKLDYVEESMVYEHNDKVCAKIVYSKDNQLLKNLSGEEIHDLIEPEIKTLNKSNLPVYKYIKEFTVTDEPLIKTTTQKIKRHEEMRNLKK